MVSRRPSLFGRSACGCARAFACAQKVLLVLQMRLNHSLTRDELTYLTIHIAAWLAKCGVSKGSGRYRRGVAVKGGLLYS